MSFEIRGLNPEERKYTYTQSQQINMQTGCIGHLRAQVEEYGAFPSSWEDHHGNQKSQVFKDELGIVINLLRFGSIYLDKHDNIIMENDHILYDDGTKVKVVTLEDRSLGTSISNPDYMKNHPDAEEEFTSLLATEVGCGIKKLYHAEIADLPAAERRGNSAMCGTIFKDAKSLSKFCYAHPELSLGNDQDWGIRVDTGQYAYLMRLNPNKGIYNLYCYCYTRDWLDHHLQEARRGIRFITPRYEEKFRIPDGDQIRITRYDGEKLDRTVRFIDDYHIEVGGGYGSNLYHICEFAEAMERNGNTVIPLRSSLPEKCFVYVESTDEIGIVKRGEAGYSPSGSKPEKGISKQEGVEHLNEAMGVSKAQAAAMSAGSMFGWDTKAADPANYNEEGILQKRSRDRGDAR